jgi:predicted nucleic acid-binding protein
VFFDANIFIYALKDDEGRFKELCKKQIERVLKGEMKAQTSTIVLNEVMYFFEINQSKEKALRVFANICAFENLEILAVDKNVLLYVPEFSRQGLDVTDAYHAATMKANSISTICSYDKGFDGIKGIKRQTPK